MKKERDSTVAVSYPWEKDGNLTNFKTWPPCRWYCDAQSCAPGQCHPNDVGCAHLAEVVYGGCRLCGW